MKLSYSNTWYRHTLRIVILAVIYYFILLTSKHNNLPNTINLLLVFCLEVLLFYGVIAFNNLVIVANYFKQKKYKRFILFEIIIVFLVSVVSFYYQKNISPFNDYKDVFQQNLMFKTINTIFYLIFGMALYFMDLWIDEKIYQTNAKLQSKEAELHFLKSQINPHFLLNALNNLYGFAFSQPEKVAYKIHELAELLRYQIEAVKKSTVDFQQEIDFIQKYRTYELDKNQQLEFLIVKPKIIPEYEIPPLLYLPLIENAVKYSLESENPRVFLEWKIEENVIFFEIKNNFDKQYRKTKSTQVGLENLKKRLEIIPYESDLQIHEEKHTFIASLTLWIRHT